MKYRGYPGRDKVTLFVVDACLIAVAAVAGWYLPTGQMDHGSHQVLELLGVGPTFLAAMYGCNMYNLAAGHGLGVFVKGLVGGGTAEGFLDGFCDGVRGR